MCGLFNEEICAATEALQAFEDCISKSIHECLFYCVIEKICQENYKPRIDTLQESTFSQGLIAKKGRYT